MPRNINNQIALSAKYRQKDYLSAIDEAVKVELKLKIDGDLCKAILTSFYNRFRISARRGKKSNGNRKRLAHKILQFKLR